MQKMFKSRISRTLLLVGQKYNTLVTTNDYIPKSLNKNIDNSNELPISYRNSNEFLSRLFY